MTKKFINDRLIASLKPAKPGQRYEFMDTALPGYAVRVTDTGHATYVLIARFPGDHHPTRRKIAKVGELSPAAARGKARQWVEKIASGIDPKRELERQRKDEQRKREHTFGAVAEGYIREVVSTHRQARNDEYHIRRVLISRWGKRPIADITRLDVRDLCRDFKQSGTIPMGHKIRIYAGSIFKWAIDQEDYGIDRSPCEGISANKHIGALNNRERIFNDDEIRAFWRVCSRPVPTSRLVMMSGNIFTLARRKDEVRYGSLFQLLLLTGARKSEISEAKWEWIDLEKKTLTVPSERFKSGRAHIFPLSDDAVAILKSLPRRDDHVFPHKGRMSAQQGRTIIDRRMLRTLRAMARQRVKVAARAAGLRGDTRADGMREAAKVELPRWTIHDLRRTCATRLSELGVDQIVIELMLGHKLPRLIGTYNRYDKLKERRAALELWARQLRRLANPQAPPDNIVRLKKVKS